MFQILLQHNNSADEAMNINRPAGDSSVKDRLGLAAYTRFRLYLYS